MFESLRVLVAAIQLVESAAHAAQTLRRVDHDRLRCVKSFARFELPREHFGVDAEQKTGGVVGVHGDFRREIAAVDEIEAVHFARFFGCRALGKGNKGIVVVARGASLAGDAL